MAASSIVEKRVAHCKKPDYPPKVAKGTLLSTRNPSTLSEIGPLVIRR